MRCAAHQSRLLHCKTYNFSVRVCGHPAYGQPIREVTLKFQPDVLAGTNVVTRHGGGEIWVGNTRHEHSLLVPWVGQVQRWRPDALEDLQDADFESVLALRPELVIFGSGTRLRFISPALMRCLIDRRIGVETMDTGAACRTYNVLVSEGRSAVAALLMPPKAVG